MGGIPELNGNGDGGGKYPIVQVLGVLNPDNGGSGGNGAGLPR